MAKFEITIKPELGCEACAVAFLNAGRHDATLYVGCPKHHGAMSIDPIIASTIAYEKRRDHYQQAVVEFEMGRGTPDPGFSREWAVEYALRDMTSAGLRMWAELDAAGIVDLGASDDDAEKGKVDARRIIALMDRAWPHVGSTLDQDGRMVRDDATAAELRINRRAEGRDELTGKLQAVAA